METFFPVVGLLLGAIGTALLIHLLRQLETASPLERSPESLVDKPVRKPCETVLPKAA